MRAGAAAAWRARPPHRLLPARPPTHPPPLPPPTPPRSGLYNAALISRLILTWFPNPPQAIVEPLSTICDPYLNLFRGIIPPLGGTLDLSPILAFVVLDVSGWVGVVNGRVALARALSRSVCLARRRRPLTPPTPSPPTSPPPHPPTHTPHTHAAVHQLGGCLAC